MWQLRVVIGQWMLRVFVETLSSLVSQCFGKYLPVRPLADGLKGKSFQDVTWLSFPEKKHRSDYAPHRRWPLEMQTETFVSLQDLGNGENISKGYKLMFVKQSHPDSLQCPFKVFMLFPEWALTSVGPTKMPDTKEHILLFSVNPDFITKV